MRREFSRQFLALSIGFVIAACGAPASEAKPNTEISALTAKVDQKLKGGNYADADKLLVQGIQRARSLNAHQDTIYLISRLVEERGAHKQIAAVHEYVDLAIELVKKLKALPGYDPEISVWMEDLADALYTHGSAEKSLAIKEYCASKSVLIECLVHDRLDNLIGSRAQLAISCLTEQKKYNQAIEVLTALLSYLHRTAPKDFAKLSNFYYTLGIAYLGANQPDKAEAAFQKCLDLDKKISGIKEMHDIHVIFGERYAALAKLEEGKLPEADKLALIAVTNHAKYIAPTHLFTAGDYLVYGSILKKEGKDKDAAHYYGLGLASYDALAKSTGSRDYDAGRVVASEGLAEADLRLGNAMQAHQLRGKISMLNQLHSNFPAKVTDEDAFFFALWSHFPTTIDPIPKESEYTDTTLLHR